jgi:hypothetical protein
MKRHILERSKDGGRMADEEDADDDDDDADNDDDVRTMMTIDND